jgi:hypothetical protein
MSAAQHEGFSIVEVPAYGALLVPSGILVAAGTLPPHGGRHGRHRPETAAAASFRPTALPSVVGHRDRDGMLADRLSADAHAASRSA